MSKRSAVTGGTRFQYHPATISFALALLGILAIFAAVGCSNDGDADLPSKTILVVGGIDTKVDPEVTTLKANLKAQKVDDDDADTIATALDTALSGNVDRPAVVDGIETRLRGLQPNATITLVKNAISGDSTPLGKAKQDLLTQIDTALKTPTGQQYKSDLEALRKRVDESKTQADLDKVQVDLNAKLLAVLGTTSTATTTTTASASPSPSGTPAPGSLSDADFAKIRNIIDEAVKQAVKDQNSNFALALIDLRNQLETGTNKAKADVIAKLDSIAKTGNDDIKNTVKELKKLLNDPNYRVQLPQTGGPNGTPVPNTAGGQTFTAKCGTFTWGPAGPAPGADSNDSPTQVRAAIKAMSVPEASQPLVTIHKMCDGDDTPNGWVIGTSSSEAAGIRVSADFLPAGVCLDYDPNVTEIKGEIEHTQRFHDRWARSFLISDGKLVTSLKTTVYWTPCTFTDGYKVKTTSVVTSGPKPSTATSGFSCSNLPKTADDLVSVFPGTKKSNWMQHPDFKHGWLYIGPEVVTLKWVEGVHHFNYDANPGNGTTKVGETPPAGSAFTVWFCS